MLNNFGDRTLPCGNPVLIYLSFESVPLYSVHACCPFMQFAMNLMMMLGMFVNVSLCTSLCMFTVSNALLMSKATATVHCGGLGLLKPFVTWWQMLCKAVMLSVNI